MPTNPCLPVRRHGPRPVFTDRLVVNVRPDQRTELTQLATALDMSLSDVVRWILDHGIDALTTGYAKAWKELQDEQAK